MRILIAAWAMFAALRSGAEIAVGDWIAAGVWILVMCGCAWSLILMAMDQEEDG